MKTPGTLRRLADTMAASLAYRLLLRAHWLSVSNSARSLFAVWLTVWVATPQGSAQTLPMLDVHLYAGLTVTGSVGTVYSIEYVSDLAQTNTPGAWRCLEFLQLPTTDYLWIDESAVANARRFYRAVEMKASTNMVFIPPGTFRMGSPTNEAGRFQDEGPETSVILSRGFWMGKYEVTQGDFSGIMGFNPSYTKGTNNPVENTTWQWVTEYCSKITQRDQAAGVICSNCVYRLPTEAEWEYACRAQTSTRFCFGDDPANTNLAKFAWYNDYTWNTRAVGQKLPNAWGLYDMYGNAAEWCQDLYGPYVGGLSLDPQGVLQGIDRILRGGGAGDPPEYCRSAKRIPVPSNIGGIAGFRIVLSPGPP